ARLLVHLNVGHDGRLRAREPGQGNPPTGHDSRVRQLRGCHLWLPVRKLRDRDERVTPLVETVAYLSRRDVLQPELVWIDPGRVRQLVDQLLRAERELQRDRRSHI